VHVADPETPREETLHALDDLVRQARCAHSARQRPWAVQAARWHKAFQPVIPSWYTRRSRRVPPCRHPVPGHADPG
jgi:aryl-alcohol dehydrogenase-like predicted oxidoreductase